MRNLIIRGDKLALCSSFNEDDIIVGTGYTTNNDESNDFFVVSTRNLDLNRVYSGIKRYFEKWGKAKCINYFILSILGESNLEDDYFNLGQYTHSFIKSFPKDIIGRWMMIRECTYTGEPSFNLHSHVLFQSEKIPLYVVKDKWQKVAVGKKISVWVGVVENRNTLFEYFANSFGIRDWPFKLKEEWFDAIQWSEYFHYEPKKIKKKKKTRYIQCKIKDLF